MKLNLFILAGGLGTRAAPLSEYRAKPAFPLLGIPLLTRVAGEIFEGSDAPEKGWINLHHQPDSVTACLRRDWPLKPLLETVLSGSRILNRSLEDEDWTHLLVINGDVYCDIPLRSLVTVAAGHDGALLVREFYREGVYRTLLSTAGRFDRRGLMAQKGMMYAGVCLLSRKVVRQIQSLNFFDDLEKVGFDLGICPYNGIWLDFGDPRSYYQANMTYLDCHSRSELELWSSESRIETDPESIKRTILWPDSVVKKGVYLENCIVCDGVSPDTGSYRNGIWTRTGFVSF